MPFIFVEWICERISYLLEHWAFLDILRYAGQLTILLAVISYFMESDARQEARHQQAWQVISASSGKPGDLGRMNAIMTLYNDKVSLAGIDLSKAYLPGLKIDNANLNSANLSGADLHGASLCGVDLHDANLASANLRSANLHGADLTDANFSGSNLLGLNLSFVNFARADLSGASLKGANLFGAAILDANLSFADLRATDLRGTDMDPWKAQLKCANVYGAKCHTEDFVELAMEFSGAVSIESDDEWEKVRRERMKEAEVMQKE